MSAEDVQHEEAVERSEEVSKEEARGSARLWFAVLGSPLAWAGHLVANYSLEEWFACSVSAHHEGEILGVAVNTVSVLINTLMLAIAVASGLMAVQCRRQLKARSDGDQLERARWMAFAGMVEGALFVGIILLGYLPALTLGACETTP